MGDVIRFKKPKAAVKAQGKTLCRSGFHKWLVSTEQQFDVKQGRLVTVYRCSRCGASKSTAH
ncbi:MAG: hypothetical protein WBN51_01905 [Gammaproteobacteria bacterium]|jgi:hypothetical protein